jgi:diacylglycerol kinase family enzyme
MSRQSLTRTIFLQDVDAPDAFLMNSNGVLVNTDGTQSNVSISISPKSVVCKNATSIVQEFLFDSILWSEISSSSSNTVQVHHWPLNTSSASFCSCSNRRKTTERSSHPFSLILPSSELALKVSNLVATIATGGSHSAGSLSTVQIPKQKLLVFINNTAGKGQAMTLFSSVSSMLAGYDIETIVSTYAGHVKKILAEMKVSRLITYSGILVAGGDGSFAEAIDGVMQRPDWLFVTSRVTFGALPCGSGNGLACSLCEAANLPCSIQSIAFLIAKKRTCLLDMASTFLYDDSKKITPNQVENLSSLLAERGYEEYVTSDTCSDDDKVIVDNGAVSPKLSMDNSPVAPKVVVQNPSIAGGNIDVSISSPFAGLRAGIWGHRMYQFLSLSWGIIADIDIESEKLRFLGASRFDVYGLIRALQLRKYQGKLSFLPSSPNKQSNQMWRSSLSRLSQRPTGAGFATGLIQSPSESGGDETINEQDQFGPASPPVLVSKLVPFDAPVPSTWRTIEGVFTLLWITNTTHQSMGVSSTPKDKGFHDDGVFTITLVRDVSPLDMVNVLLSLDGKGSWHALKTVETFTCSAFRLEPTPKKSETSPGHVSLDGEDVAYTSVQAEIHDSFLKVFGAPGATMNPSSV